MQQDKITILPLSSAPQAFVRVPGSKSLTNRALLIASLANGTTTLTNALFSDDSRYFAESLVRLGFKIHSDADTSTIAITGREGHIPATQAELFIGNAGTAARFLTAMLTLAHGEYVVDGDSRMRQRPIEDLVDALSQIGAQLQPLSSKSDPQIPQTICPPISIHASGLPGGCATVAGNVSSQYLSGLLMVAPYAQSPVELIVTHGLNSKPYVDMTIAVMEDFGVIVEREGYESFSIHPQRYRTPGEYTIESDASAASYFFAAPAICGGTVHVENISRRSCQGDIAFLDVLTRMGCTVSEGHDWMSVTGPEDLRGVEVNLSDMSDMALTLAVIAPFASTPTVIRGIASTRQKETDRVAALCAELTRLGVPVTELPDGLVIQPCHTIQPATIRTYDDHRMAMAFALIGLRVPGITIENPDCVSKTFPDYFMILEQLRHIP
jgi:3-phosphoshikimate 1-carboxyvinyltransferase